jgi:hypothetical protein
VVLLRDGEWFWLCHCGWQSPPAPGTSARAARDRAMEPGLPLPFHAENCRRSWSTRHGLSTSASRKEGGSSSNSKTCDEGRAVPAELQRWPGPPT